MHLHFVGFSNLFKKLMMHYDLYNEVNHMCVIAVLWWCVLFQYCGSVGCFSTGSVGCCSTVMVCIVAVL